MPQPNDLSRNPHRSGTAVRQTPPLFGGPGAAVGTTPVPGATAEDRGPGPKIPTKRLESLYHCPCPR
jgi:hypothetical protein